MFIGSFVLFPGDFDLWPNIFVYDVYLIANQSTLHNFFCAPLRHVTKYGTQHRPVIASRFTTFRRRQIDTWQPFQPSSEIPVAFLRSNGFLKQVISCELWFHPDAQSSKIPRHRHINTYLVIWFRFVWVGHWTNEKQYSETILYDPEMVRTAVIMVGTRISHHTTIYSVWWHWMFSLIFHNWTTGTETWEFTTNTENTTR